MMPTLFGEPFYPAGFPLRPEAIRINSVCLQDILLKYWERKACKEEEEMLKEYVLYYLGAPLFKMEYDNEEQEQIFKNLPLDSMLDVLLDAGIDPL